MPLHTSSRRIILLAVALVCVARALTCAQSQAPPKAPASVSGRVTIEEKGAAGVTVGLLSAEFEQPGGRRTVAKTKTDAEGRYKLSGIAPGRYNVAPFAPAFVVSEFNPDREGGRPVVLDSGDEVEDINFTLTRGGVITGRVTDADGKPVIGESVSVMPEDESLLSRLPNLFPMNVTDDRGVYRLYGLPTGRYRVSVGYDTKSGMGRRGGPRGFYQRTFHPDATEREHAKIVGVEAGGEAVDVDIKLGKLSETFRARGRFVLADTGRPAPNVLYGFGVVFRDGKRLGAFGLQPGSQTNARGEFQIDGLTPGRYGVFARADNSSDLYSDTATFEIADADADGIEVKLHRGATLSGFVAIEGARDPALVARLLRRITLATYGDSRDGLNAPRFDPARVNPDGSFRFNGLRPGKIQITQGYDSERGLSLARVEHNDATTAEGGIEITEGAQVTGVRVVFTYGTGVVRGQVVLTGGGQPAGQQEEMRMWVSARPAGVQSSRSRPTEVDARGRFVLEGLPPGEVELTAHANGGGKAGSVTQAVSVPDGGEANVTLTINLSNTAPRVRP